MALAGYRLRCRVAGAGSATALARIMQTGIAIAVAAASWRWIEAPILRSGLRAFIGSGSGRLARSIAAAPCPRPAPSR